MWPGHWDFFLSLFTSRISWGQNPISKSKPPTKLKSFPDDSSVQSSLIASSTFWSSNSHSLMCICITQGSSNADSDSVVWGELKDSVFLTGLPGNADTAGP